MAAQTRARTYYATWGALLVLTGCTMAASSLTRGRAEVALTLLSSTAKASLVALFFMHLAQSRFMLRAVLVVAAAFVAILVALTAADVALRPPVPVLQPKG